MTPRDIARRQDIGLAFVRIITGIVFLAHGWMKLFSFHLPGVTGMLAGMGFPVPGFLAVVLTFAELLCGIALIIGLFTRLAAVPLIIDMLVVVFIVKFPGGFFAPRGYEFELLLAVNSVALAIAGGGAYALDNVLRQRRSAP